MARKDAMIHRDSARKTVKNFDKLPEELQMVATDIDLNVKGKFKTFPKLKKALEDLDFDEMEKQHERSAEIKNPTTGEKEKILLTRRNKPTLNLIRQAKAILTQPFKKGGMVERDPYKRQPRFI